MCLLTRRRIEADRVQLANMYLRARFIARYVDRQGVRMLPQAQPFTSRSFNIAGNVAAVSKTCVTIDKPNVMNRFEVMPSIPRRYIGVQGNLSV